MGGREPKAVTVIRFCHYPQKLWGQDRNYGSGGDLASLLWGIDSKVSLP